MDQSFLAVIVGRRAACWSGSKHRTGWAFDTEDGGPRHGIAQHGQVYRGFRNDWRSGLQLVSEAFRTGDRASGGSGSDQSTAHNSGTSRVIMSQALGALCRDLREDGK